MRDEDACYAAAQWASGVRQGEIGATFGVSASYISGAIERFVRRHSDCDRYMRTDTGRLVNSSFVRRSLVKGAVARFVALREARLHV